MDISKLLLFMNIVEKMDDYNNTLNILFYNS